MFVYNPGACCTSTVNFDSFFIDFVKTEKIDFFTISFNEIDKTSIAKHVKYYPTVVIFNKGKITAYLDAESDNDLYYYESIAGFKEWFSKYVYLNKLLKYKNMVCSLANFYFLIVLKNFVHAIIN